MSAIRIWLILSGLNGLIAVIAGAYGYYSLKAYLAAQGFFYWYPKENMAHISTYWRGLLQSTKAASVKLLRWRLVPSQAALLYCQDRSK